MKLPARNHPQQVAARFLAGDAQTTDAIDNRATPPALFEEIHNRFSFTLDVAASAENAKLPRFLDRAADGLATSWAGERVWCNPPYSNLGAWVAKAWTEIQTKCPLVVMIVPANRTEQRWWHQLVEPFRDRGADPVLRVEFLSGRRRFIMPGREAVGPNERPPFGCCLLIWTAPPPLNCASIRPTEGGTAP